MSNGVTEIWLVGSFTTADERPQDVDVTYRTPDGANARQWGILNPAREKELKKRSRVHLIPDLGPGQSQLFTTDRDGVERGIVQIVRGEDLDDS